MRNIIVPVVTYVVGLATGIALSYIPLGSDTKPINSVSTPPFIAESSEKSAQNQSIELLEDAQFFPVTETGTNGPVVTLEFYDKNNAVIQLSQGILVGEKRQLITTLPFNTNITAGAIVNETGQRIPLQNIIGVDIFNRLIVIETHFSNGLYLNIDEPITPLFLGQAVDVQLTTTKLATTISNSGENLTDFGALHYKTQLNNIQNWIGAALTNSDNQLLGMVVRSTQNANYFAISTDTIDKLFQNTHLYKAQDIPSFYLQLLESPEGLVALLKSFSETKNWNAIMSHVARYENLEADYQALARPYIITAFKEYINTSLRNLDYKKAIRDLNFANTLLGKTPDLLAVEANIYRVINDPQKEKLVLEEMLELEPHRGVEIRDRLRQLVVADIHEILDNNLPLRAVNILEDEILLDQNFAEYHLLLGRAYYSLSQYESALKHLLLTVNLEPELEGQLKSMINTAQQRASNEEYIEIPLSSEGRIIYVNVILNHSDETHRFVLDTGASFTAIATHVAQALDLNIDESAPVTINTANGTAKAFRTNLDSIDLNGALVNNVPTLVIDTLGSEIDGLLGLSFLSHFNVEINQNDNKLILTSR